MLLKNQKEINAYKKERLKSANCDLITGYEIKNPVLDHDHETGYCREVIDRDLNQFIGKIESNYKRFLKHNYPNNSLSYILRRVAEYLEEDYRYNFKHPDYIKIETRKFRKYSKEVQYSILEAYNLEPAKNLKGRLSQYRKIIIGNVISEDRG